MAMFELHKLFICLMFAFMSLMLLSNFFSKYMSEAYCPPINKGIVINNEGGYAVPK